MKEHPMQTQTQNATFPVHLPNGVVIPVTIQQIRKKVGTALFDRIIGDIATEYIREAGEQLSLMEGPSAGAPAPRTEAVAADDLERDAGPSSFAQQRDGAR